MFKWFINLFKKDVYHFSSIEKVKYKLYNIKFTKNDESYHETIYVDIYSSTSVNKDDVVIFLSTGDKAPSQFLLLMSSYFDCLSAGDIAIVKQDSTEDKLDKMGL